ncbi:MAG: DNA primase DnaG [Thermoprotei archaeon]
MGGASLASAKYEALFSLEVDGPVDRADIVGALFGQTEGLFTEEYDLRELQEKGKIGRIQINSEVRGKKTIGEITVPSNLSKEETAFIIAIIESVDKVGPYNARIELKSFKDLRQQKREEILKRTKEIIEKQKEQENVGSVEEALMELMYSIKGSSIEEYGQSRLPAGPDVKKSEEVILVEGRADVVNLLKHGYKNALALGGATGGNIPKEVIELGKERTLIAFLDGDRGGDMILRELEEAGVDIDFVARAPSGKEVEELTGKEIARALDAKEPFVKTRERIEERARAEAREAAEQESVEARPEQATEQVVEKAEEQQKEEVKEQVVPPAQVAQVRGEEQVHLEEAAPQPTVDKKVIDVLDSVQGTLEAVLLDSKLNTIARIPVGDLAEKLGDSEPDKVYAVVFDGVITQRLVDIAAEKNVKTIIGVRVGNVSKNPPGLTIMSEKELRKR